MKSRAGKKKKRVEDSQKKEHTRARKSKERRYTRAKCSESRESLCFSNGLSVGGVESTLAKAAGAEPCGQRRNEKLHAAVAQSTFSTQNVQNTPFIFKPKCTRHASSRPVLEVRMSKNCMPLWCEAHLQVKMHKTHHAGTTLGSSCVENGTPLWRGCFICQRGMVFQSAYNGRLQTAPFAGSVRRARSDERVISRRGLPNLPRIDFKEKQHFRRAAFLSAALLRSLSQQRSQQPFSAALLSSLLSSLSQPFSAAFLSSSSQQPF